jgi:30S ribosomal protein S31
VIYRQPDYISVNSVERVKGGVVFMGKGDKKTRKGKIYRGSFGKSRPRKKTKTKKK